jgi:hypothetical protein
VCVPIVIPHKSSKSQPLYLIIFTSFGTKSALRPALLNGWIYLEIIQLQRLCINDMRDSSAPYTLSTTENWGVHTSGPNIQEFNVTPIAQPFELHIPEEAIVDLNERLLCQKWLTGVRAVFLSYPQ